MKAFLFKSFESIQENDVLVHPDGFTLEIGRNSGGFLYISWVEGDRMIRRGVKDGELSEISSLLYDLSELFDSGFSPMDV